MIPVQDWCRVGTKDSFKIFQVAHALIAQRGLSAYWNNIFVFMCNTRNANIANCVFFWKPRMTFLSQELRWRTTHLTHTWSAVTMTAQLEPWQLVIVLATTLSVKLTSWTRGSVGPSSSTMQQLPWTIRVLATVRRDGTCFLGVMYSYSHVIQ